MRRIKTTLISCAAVLLIHGCTNTPNTNTKQTHPLAQATTHQELYRSAQEYFELWGESFSPSDLNKSYTLFKQALKKQPDNIQYQKAFYLVLFATSILENQHDEAALEKQFNAIHPAIRPSIAAPAKSTFIKAKALNKPQEELLPILERAIQQQPYDPYPWLELSQIYAKQNHFWLAAAAAKQAQSLDLESGAPSYQLGLQLNNIADARLCANNTKALSQQAIKHISRASSKEPNNADYLYAQAYIYQVLDLMPLALMQVKKAIANKETQWNLRLHIQILLNLKKYKEAKELSRRLIKQFENNDGYLFLALGHAGLEEWGDSYDAYKNYTLHVKPSLYHSFILNWLHNIDNNKKDLPKLNSDTATNKWEHFIYDYVFAEKVNEEDNLLYLAENQCEKTLGHFFTAYRAWIKNSDKDDAVKHHLQQTKSLRILRYPEYYWAQSLLDGLN
ncbi:hypothetical protein [Teredinibacter sp. KSP-S5-2]|uniref:tetratricopeptide repeat protein n=1 Tax=Teredinibacter sp. KSP-S5-2 TaxID=3034506 RepID=UPI00293493DD|nr:hypothetical protein [Teredinibacter sp. KSP-S5-2]WNO10195.1 hypothetical protein P5V12_03315 [Teredinibacter sp. KSP-S5-2]